MHSFIIYATWIYKCVYSSQNVAVFVNYLTNYGLQSFLHPEIKHFLVFPFLNAIFAHRRIIIVGFSNGHRRVRGVILDELQL